ALSDGAADALAAAGHGDLLALQPEIHDRSPSSPSRSRLPRSGGVRTSPAELGQATILRRGRRHMTAKASAAMQRVASARSRWARCRARRRGFTSLLAGV